MSVWSNDINVDICFWFIWQFSTDRVKNMDEYITWINKHVWCIKYNKQSCVTISDNTTADSSASIDAIWYLLVATMIRNACDKIDVYAILHPRFCLYFISNRFCNNVCMHSPVTWHNSENCRSVIEETRALLSVSSCLDTHGNKHNLLQETSCLVINSYDNASNQVLLWRP